MFQDAKPCPKCQVTWFYICLATNITRSWFGTFKPLKTPPYILILENKDGRIHLYWGVTENAAKVRDLEMDPVKVKRTLSGYGHSGWIAVGLSWDKEASGQLETPSVRSWSPGIAQQMWGTAIFETRLTGWLSWAPRSFRGLGQTTSTNPGQRKEDSHDLVCQGGDKNPSLTLRMGLWSWLFAHFSRCTHSRLAYLKPFNLFPCFHCSAVFINLGTESHQQKLKWNHLRLFLQMVKGGYILWTMAYFLC